MKKYLLWTFERGSKPYDAICGIILAFIFLTPPAVFNDRPDYMRISETETVRETRDKSGNVVFTVKLDTPAFSGDGVNEQVAKDLLKAKLGEDVTISKMEPVYSTTGALLAYSIWIER
jgi:hypothetical protein